MSVSVPSAVAAYARQAKQNALQGSEPRSADPGKTFADLVTSSLESAVETGRNSEALSAKAIAGKADLNEVVTAVTSAEVTLQTVLSIRDRVIQAYQEILRMPI